MTQNRKEIWTSVLLYNKYLEYGGSSKLGRLEVLNHISASVNDLVILSANGYAKIVLFQDNATATLNMTKIWMMMMKN